MRMVFLFVLGSRNCSLFCDRCYAGTGLYQSREQDLNYILTVSREKRFLALFVFFS